MRATIPVYQLQKPAERNDPGQAAVGPGIFVKRSTRRAAATEIDLRGQRVDAALDKVEGILNDAALAGASDVRIIHGKGTGALRQAIREYLDGHPLVESLAAGEGSGGDGVTVVALR
jgi:DNA mismatch repair protein MutS2